MLTDHLKPGHLVYMRAEAEAPASMPAFVTWVAATQAHRLGQEMTEQARQAAYAVARDEGLMQVWRETSAVTTKLATATAEAIRLLALMLRREGIEVPDIWAQARLRELEQEAREARRATA